ncbi:MAG: DUF4450 domain-containing protein [Leadbetterella sp.]|nr:DUF4450 domain-containing protein [Leadbetterella sp.]
MKFFLLVLILLGPRAVAQQEKVILKGENATSEIEAAGYPEFSFRVPELAGTLKLGVIRGGESVWLKDVSVAGFSKENSGVKYTLKDPVLGNGSLVIEAVSLSRTDGLVLEAEARDLQEDVKLFWAFGGASGREIPGGAAGLNPDDCKNNVFSVEGSLFTVYYGESMKLKVFQGVTPPGAEIRLSDAGKQEPPLAFFNSGKRTQTPSLAAALPLKKDDKLYFCFYRQNSRADYNYFMLPEVFFRSKKTGGGKTISSS